MDFNALFSLKGRVALVTGGSRGIGKMIVEGYLAAGAERVYISARKVPQVEETVAELGDRVIGLPFDLGTVEGCEALAAEFASREEKLDILVNNAGVGSVDAFADIADETWSRVIGVNLTGAFHCARAAVRAMKAKGTKGTVINVSSTAALSGDGPAHYCASKAALMGLTRSMAKELAPLGIRVNTIVPGPTNTPMMQGIPQEWADAIVKGVPMGRMAEPEDIASVALFLASADSAFMTGQTLLVDGGIVLD